MANLSSLRSSHRSGRLDCLCQEAGKVYPEVQHAGWGGNLEALQKASYMQWRATVADSRGEESGVIGMLDGFPTAA